MANTEPVVLPTGIVTFLLTDVEGSTRLWEAEADTMGPAIVRHYEILDEEVTAAAGVRPIEQGEGDSVVAAFVSARDAIVAAMNAQRRLCTELPRLPVRIAIHTGQAQLRDDGNYVGRTIIRCARLRAAAHGGQILVSETTAALIVDDLPSGTGMADLGTRQLKDLSRPERIWQLTHGDLPRNFPPLRSLEVVSNNLPRAATSFVGRDAELATISSMVRTNRVITLTGSGGCGKLSCRNSISGLASSIDAYKRACDLSQNSCFEDRIQ